MPIATQNWDGVTPPAAPAGWTLDSPLATTTQAGGFAGLAPTSAPNMLGLVAPGTNTHYFATYGTLDGNSGNVTVSANFNAAGTANNQTFGLTLRGSTNALDVTSTTFYWMQFSPFRTELFVYKMIAGAQTALATLSPIVINIPVWYSCYFSALGTALTVSIQRSSDGNWLTPSGTWGVGVGYAINITDSAIAAAQGYSGLTLQSRSDDAVSDDWALNSSGSTATFPLPTVTVVRIPAAYYPHYSE